MNTLQPPSMTQLQANPAIIKMWSERTKCWQCKHRFDKPVLLPVGKPETGKLQPHFNPDLLVHVSETHGIWPEAVITMIMNSIYGIENTMASVYGETL